MGVRTVKNYPSPRLMETIGATNQKPPEAIGELVANCFDARVGDEKMVIVVDMRNEQIVVTDNGKGMTDAVLEKAVCIAEDMSRHIERGEGAKGHFGMGFKTSCSTLGQYYEIFTRPIGESVEYHVAFNISDYSRRPSGEDAWNVDIEDKPVDGTGPLGEAIHGTSFVIKRLKDKDIVVSAVLRYLGDAFKGHLEMGDEIIIIDANGAHQAKPREYRFVRGSRIDIDTACGPNNAYVIRGWMAIDEQTHNDGLYGFNIYRNNQLIETWDKSWFRAHLMTSRIIGEVHMDFLDATFYKQGLQQSEVWHIVQAHMREFLKPLVKASNALSKKGNINKAAERNRIIDELRDGYDEDPLPASSADTEGSPVEGGKKPDQPRVKDKVKAVVKERSLVLPDEGEIVITYSEYANEATTGKILAPFDYIYDEGYEDDEPSALQVIVYTNHPIWDKKVDKEAVKVLATADAIYRALVERVDYEPNNASRIRNEWIWKRTAGEEA